MSLMISLNAIILLDVIPGGILDVIPQTFLKCYLDNHCSNGPDESVRNWFFFSIRE